MELFSMSDDINDGIKNAKDTMVVVGEIIKNAGDNPKVKEAGDNLGQAALTLSKTINNALLPLAAINFSFDKARNYFAKNFEKDLAEKASKIPQEDIVEPKASIAGPTLQGLAFTHEEENLKDMYLSLLATAMDEKTTNNAHPAFVEIIRQLTSEEAHLVQGILKASSLQPICEVRVKVKGTQEWFTLTKHLLNITNTKTGEAVENERFPSMVENWIRLGLVETTYTNHLADSKNYDWVETRPEVKRLRTERENEEHEVIIQKGILTPTALGIQFSKAVGIQ